MTIALYFKNILVSKSWDIFSFQLIKLTPTSITLEKMDFSASGSYACEIALETPLYSKVSKIHELNVIGEYPILHFDAYKTFSYKITRKKLNNKVILWIIFRKTFSSRTLKSIVPLYCLYRARMIRNVIISHPFSCVQSAFIELQDVNQKKVNFGKC